jgi:two-component system, response regulator PdtaR
VIAASDSPDSEVERQRTVLVVEDDVLERGPLAEYLRDAGFRVIEAANGHEAVEVLSSEMTVDIVFSDIRMPGEIDGLALAHWVDQRMPNVRVLLTSGDRALHIERLPGPGHYIGKPYIYRDVERLLRQLMGEK